MDYINNTLTAITGYAIVKAPAENRLSLAAPAPERLAVFFCPDAIKRSALQGGENVQRVSVKYPAVPRTVFSPGAYLKNRHSEKILGGSMCTCPKSEVRPGLDGILDYCDKLNSIKGKVDPLLNLIINIPMSHDGKSNYTDDDIASLLVIVRELLDDAWIVADGIHSIYKGVRNAA